MIQMPRPSDNPMTDIPLTEDSRRLELQELFNQVDTDRDGYVCYAELWQFLRLDDHKIPRHIIRQIQEKADRNDDGRLNFREFVKMTTDPENKKYFSMKKCIESYMDFLLPPQSVHREVSTNVHRPPIAISTRGAPQMLNMQFRAPIASAMEAKALTFFDELDDDTQDSRHEDRYPCWPPQVSMIFISLMVVVLFMIDALQGEKTGSGPMGKVLIYNPHRRKEAWRYVSYMFVHIGSFHLLVNLLVQLMLGVPLEMVHKWWRVLIVYLSGVLAGSLGTSVCDPGVYLAGASGGVYSLLTAHIASIIMNWRDMRYPLVQIMFFLVLICTDVGTFVHNRYVEGTTENIGYAAHCFGALAGLLVGLTVLKNLEITSQEKRIRWVAWTIYLILMTAAVVINIVAPIFPEQHV